MGARKPGDRERQPSFITPFPLSLWYVSPGISRIPGSSIWGLGREFRPVPSYAVNPAPLPFPDPGQTVKFWSLAQPGWCIYLGRQQHFQTLRPSNREEGFPWQGREGTSPRALTAASSCATSPPPVLGHGDPGPKILPAALDSPRGETALSATCPRPRSCFTNQDSKLHPFLPPFHHPPTSMPKGEKAT